MKVELSVGARELDGRLDLPPRRLPVSEGDHGDETGQQAQDFHEGIYHDPAIDKRWLTGFCCSAEMTGRPGRLVRS